MRLSERLRSLFPMGNGDGRIGFDADDSVSIEILLGKLEDVDPSVRRHAVITLGVRGDVRAVGPIIAMLSDRDDAVRLEAVIALGLIGDPAAVEPLIEKLKSYDYLYVRKKAAYTLYTFLKLEHFDDSLRQKIRSH